MFVPRLVRSLAKEREPSNKSLDEYNSNTCFIKQRIFQFLTPSMNRNRIRVLLNKGYLSFKLSEINSVRLEYVFYSTNIFKYIKKFKEH